jgi:hypothetical protein
VSERRVATSEQERYSKPSYEVSTQRAELLKKNRESHYDYEPRRAPENLEHNHKVNSFREIAPPRPAPPREPIRPPPRPVERQVVYNPLSAPREPPRQPPPQRPAYNPMQPPRHRPEPQVNPELKLINDLKKFRKTIPEPDTRPPPAPMRLPSNPSHQQDANRPKGRRVNPKDDPNCIYCFRCSIWHHKDLHMQSVPQLTARRPQSGPGGTVASQPSRPSAASLHAQQAALHRAIKPDPVYLPRRPPPRRRDDDSEDDEFDYDDGFIVDDMDEPQDWGRELRKVTGYNPDAYDDEDFDDRDMEVRDFAELEREDLRSRYYGSARLTRPKR